MLPLTVAVVKVYSGSPQNDTPPAATASEGGGIHTLDINGILLMLMGYYNIVS